MFRLYEIAVVRLRVSKIYKKKEIYISETCILMMVVSYGRNM
jgi:hypothetical protein